MTGAGRFAGVVVSVAAAGLTSGWARLGAQQQAPPQQRPPVFRGEAVLVTVDAYPQREGRIVENLTAADFQILEDGKPQTVELTEFVRVEPSLSEAARRDPNSTREMLDLAADPHNRVFVVFLDQLHVSLDGSSATRRPMVDALNRIIGTDDLFAIMTQNTDPRALTFGRRLLSVEEQLTKFWTWGERNRLSLDPAEPMETSLKACYEHKPPRRDEVYRPWYYDDNGQRRLLYEVLVDRLREDRTMTALERLVDRLGGLREARTVTLLVTEGWRLFREDRAMLYELNEYGTSLPPVGSAGGRVTLGDPTNTGDRSFTYEHDCQKELARLAAVDNDRRLQDIIRRANRANVSFYPINPAGVVAFDTPPTSGRTVAESVGKQVILSQLGPPSLAEDSRRLRSRADAVLTLAENTDGIAVLNTNDIGAGLKRIVDDVSAYYLLGYYSTNPAHDGRFRRIEVKMKAPDVRVRARRGYFAPADKPSRDGASAPAATTPAAAAPPKGLDEVLGELARLRPDADVFARGVFAGDSAIVAVEVASGRSSSAPWISGSEVQVVATGADGSALPPVTARLEPATRGVLVAVPVSGALASARIVAKVSAGGQAIEGTADVRRAPPGLVGDAILYRGRPAPTSPLRPVADLQYRRTERVHVEWILTAEIDQRSARLLSRTGQPLAVPVGVTERETDGRRVVAADLNLAPLSAGEYVIELTVGRAGTAEVKLVAFRVLQ